MSCSKAYRALVVTSDGYTPDNQYGWYPTPLVYEQWRTLANELLIRTKTHLDRLQGANKTAAQTEEANGYVEQYNSFVERADAFPSPWLCCIHEQDTIRSVSLASNLAVETVCLMEVIDQALAKVGLKPPSEPTTVNPASTPQNDIANTVALVGIGAGLFWWWNNR